MFVIVVPGRLGALNVVYDCAAKALEKYREMESEGLTNIDVKDTKGESVNVSDLERGVKEANQADRT